MHLVIGFYYDYFEQIFKREPKKFAVYVFQADTRHSGTMLTLQLTLFDKMIRGIHTVRAFSIKEAHYRFNFTKKNIDEYGL